MSIITKDVIKTFYNKTPIAIKPLSSCAYKITFPDEILKLEVFKKGHKLYNSLPVHKKGLSKGLTLPLIIKVKEIKGLYYKLTEWFEGKSLENAIENKKVIYAFSEYIHSLYVYKILAKDSHFNNFIWTGNKIVYIDLKKLMFGEEPDFITQIAKIVLKQFKGDRAKAILFLRGLSNYHDITLIIKECDRRGWKWANMKGVYTYLRPIKISEDIL